MKTRILLTWLAGSVMASAAPGDDYFEAKVRPLLVERCYECHSHDKKIKGGLVLDSRSGWEKGGDTGPALVPGKPEESLLVKAISHTDKDLAMPPKKKLSDEEIAVLNDWVKMGAPDPRVEVANAPAFDYPTARRQWAFHSPDPVTLPAVKDEAWVQSPVDRFILTKLEAKGFAPAPQADRRTLLRRATFDLIGLPPTPQEMADFLADQSPDAFSKVVDRLLASPRYGERWARHWLDVVRYTDSFDTRGFGTDSDITFAWRYRDWVAKAFNRDLPYDQFITQQVAGDLMAEPAGGPFDPEKIVATGLYAIGNWGNGDADKEKAHTDIIDDQIDVTGRAFLGLTLACARCHDHKFDPISTADYYGLAGFFFSSRILDHFADKTAGEKPMRIPLLPAAEVAKRAVDTKRLAEIDAQLAKILPPLAKVSNFLEDKPDLSSWHLKGKENPSLTINKSEDPAEYGTISLPGRSIALHPGPADSVTAAWRSPLAGRVRIDVYLHDANGSCGDGVDWAVRNGGRTIGSGTIENGRGASFTYEGEKVAVADLLQLIIRPRENYQCDTTQIEFVVTADDGQKWDLRQAVLGGATNGSKNLWWVCAGEGEKLVADRADLVGVRAERSQLEAELTPPPMCHGLREGGIPQTAYEGFHDAHVHVRGRYDKLGDLIPRRFPTLLAGENRAPIHDGSGRLELAHWLASAENPLTARVMANRIWQHHFGEGIVRTPNNFGKLGTPPTHPELLDWLAGEFVKSGWSIKAMHRLIMNSAAYQQASLVDAPTSEEDSAQSEQFRNTLREDPANLLFGRQNRRRLEAESLRDAMLFAAGNLDLTEGGPSVRDLTSPRRTFYITTIRADRATYQMLFDAADPTAIVEKRIESTVAPQALWLLNHPFAMVQSSTLATRARAAAADDAGRVNWLYETLYGRPANPQEILIGEKAVAAGDDTAWAAYCQILFCANEFIYLD